MRKWLPHFGELVDRLSIHQLKEVFLSDHKEKYSKEMEDIVHDLNVLIQEKDIKLTGELIHAIVGLSQMNEHIWYNEAGARKGEDQDLSKLKLTHGLNGLRNRLMNMVLDLVGDENRQDYKTDCLAAEFKDWDMGILHD